MSELQTWASHEFGDNVHITTIRRIIKDERTTISYNIKDESAKTRKNFHRPRFPDLDMEVAQWVAMANEQQAGVTGRLIPRAATRIVSRLNLQGQVKCSNGWLNHMQIRHNLKMHRLHGEAASASPAEVDSGRVALQNVTRLYRAPNIYNMDETGLFYNGQPRTTIADKPRPGQKQDKNRTSVALATNVDGSDKLAPILTNWRLLKLPPNTTAFLQPMDADIIACFKRHY
ncbi:hypothetical protein H310_14772 [Aphanomyces invadans]|uniref:HTH CENPB-type domain-containing protein n=1 Tax=Aphanomyces invadans TaxID=157072 RepID=A0A024T903_9STRA|nr:hypothetical protein H310_14772 [Aphanomyces invadans]ETV90449.1 hypothetical protein H310_14772 [Aphanomyces invadans]|eukprot:XP_008880923.1 hypothetical protein H310_14772 [Aphanomyces invadans]